ncbi:MAG TPA: ribose 5-phosphate isomerase B [Planctomycetota bacterium]|nr:ribose 5-phosphate isomerase B [Planctomycetota bacterium]HPY75234.1 ribose 5-phosphate isomerase B [Planctomycetota bacterium]HQB00782.1 ribose 5-phosphate isomerase B [Planctomycetota bacterium]HRU51980.1 ribose 5-phosphate isomerase B [Planctomycetota bacterium]
MVIGADHGGYTLKEIIKKELKKMGHTVIDVGTHSTDSVDYPDYAYAVANCVASGQCKRGIMIDGVGIGSAMLANKIKGIRAANCHNIFEIKNSRAHNDANILTLGGRVLGDALAVEMVKVWLETSFEGGRHQKRIDKIMKWD